MMIKHLVPAVLLAGLMVSPAVLAKPKPCKGCYCSVTATDVNFGTYDALTKPTLYSTGNVTVTCGTDTIGDVMSYEIALDFGKKGKSPRQMDGGKDALEYNLYTNASHTILWGDGKKYGSVTVPDSYTFTSLCCEVRSYTDYGVLFGGQNVRPGLYSDDIVVEVSW